MSFEFDGEKYKKASSHQKEWGEKLISEFNFKGYENILDLGCGDGSITAQLAKQLPNGFVTGIDASKGMIQTAIKNHKLKNLTFELIDINSIDYYDKFDVIISNATLHWIKDHKTLLKNVQKALKNEGIARFNFAADGNCSSFFKVIKQVMALPEYSEYFNDFIWPWYMPDIGEYKSLVEQITFSEATVWGENSDRNFPDISSMVKWIDQPSIVPFLKLVDDKDKSEFRDLVVKLMIEETHQPDDTCFETFRRVNLKVIK
jgi:trans-aconitate 2-methyltransferase